MRHIGILAAILLLAGSAYAKDADTAELSPKEAKDGFVSLFDGRTLKGWQGDVKGYAVENGTIVCNKSDGNLFTAKQYANFVFRFEFKLPPAGNNGVGIRTPLQGIPAYVGMEIQILDDSDPSYKTLETYQFHGSIYGVVPAKRGSLKPVGQWNQEEIIADGSRIKVTVNGHVIVDADLSKIDKTLDHQPHPGLHNAKGYVGWLGHGDPVAFRNIRIKTLP
jgi:hypothetical protein